jgi:high-affinity iron transporter
VSVRQSSALIAFLLALSGVPVFAQSSGDSLLVPIGSALVDASDSQWTAVSRDLDRFAEGWRAYAVKRTAESRAVDTALRDARRAVDSAAAAPAGVAPALRSLVRSVDSWLAASRGPARSLEKGVRAVADETGVAAARGPARSVQDLIVLLEKSRDALKKGNAEAASAALQGFIEAWPAVEGSVRTRAPAAYSGIENLMIEATAQLLSGPDPRQAAAETIQEMIDTLAPLGGGRFTAIDAGLVLLREGLEALLVLVALLAMLSRSGQQKGKAYVWSGAGAGLLLSIGLAVTLSLVLSASTGGMARESLEGFVGLAAVALMLTVGAWLHRNASIKAWNAYIKGRVGDAIARGRNWSLFAVAGLAILREGAETVIFLAGMASSLSTLQLIAGIGGALALLAAAGFAVIRFSVRLPIHHLFLAATIVIFYLSFKIAGESVHSLQVAGIVPARYSAALPSIGFLGMFPTWETSILQLVIVLLIVTQIAVTEARRAR